MKVYPCLSYRREINETDVNYTCNLPKVWDSSDSLKIKALKNHGVVGCVYHRERAFIFGKISSDTSNYCSRTWGNTSDNSRHPRAFQNTPEHFGH